MRARVLAAVMLMFLSSFLALPFVAAAPLPAPTFLGSDAHTGGASSVTISSITPAANSLLVIPAIGWNSMGSAFTFSSVTDTFTQTLTWTEQVTTTSDTINFHRVSIWTAEFSASETGDVTVTTSASITRARAFVIEVTGQNENPIGQTASAGPNSDNSTFSTSSFASAAQWDSLIIGVYGSRVDTDVTPGAGYTEIAEEAGGCNPCNAIQAQFANGQSSSSWSGIATTDEQGDVLALEILAPPDPVGEALNAIIALLPIIIILGVAGGLIVALGAKYGFLEGSNLFFLTLVIVVIIIMVILLGLLQAFT